MVDHEERQVLQQIEDDKLVEARRKAIQDSVQEQHEERARERDERTKAAGGAQPVVETDDTGEERAGTEADQEGVDTDDITG